MLKNQLKLQTQINKTKWQKLTELNSGNVEKFQLQIF